MITLQSGSDWGVGGGGETMMVHDVNHMRTEMIGESPSFHSLCVRRLAFARLCFFPFLSFIFAYVSCFMCAALLERLSGLLVNTKDRRVFFVNNFDMVSPRFGVLPYKACNFY